MYRYLYISNILDYEGCSKFTENKTQRYCSKILCFRIKESLHLENDLGFYDAFIKKNSCNSALSINEKCKNFVNIYKTCQRTIHFGYSAVIIFIEGYVISDSVSGL